MLNSEVGEGTKPTYLSLQLNSKRSGTNQSRAEVRQGRLSLVAVEHAESSEIGSSLQLAANLNDFILVQNSIVFADEP